MVRTALLFLMLAGCAFGEAGVVVIDSLIDPGGCASHGLYEAALYSVKYSLTADPPDTPFDVIFAYNSSLTDLAACFVTDVVGEASTMGAPGSIEFSDHFVNFNNPFWIMITNRGTLNASLVGTMEVDVSFANFILQHWIYFALGFGLITLLCLVACLVLPLVRKCRQRASGEIELGRW